jgi:hypothetical protein
MQVDRVAIYHPAIRLLDWGRQNANISEARRWPICDPSIMIHESSDHEYVVTNPDFLVVTHFEI